MMADLGCHCNMPGRTSTKELTPSDWYVGTSVGYFLIANIKSFGQGQCRSQAGGWTQPKQHSSGTSG